MKAPLQIEILGFDGCPNLPSTVELVESLVSSEGVEADLSLIQVTSMEDAERLGFLGSPSVRVNGIEVDPSRQHEGQHAFSCRVYHSESGATGLPPASWIQAAIKRQL